MSHTVDETINSLIQELRVLERKLTATEAGTSLIERALLPASRKAKIAQNESSLDLSDLRTLVFKIVAIYGCIRSLNPDFFSFVAANDSCRALWNNGIPSENLLRFIINSADFLDMATEGTPMPDELRSELNHIRKRFPATNSRSIA
jgi:hypothetical protein